MGNTDLLERLTPLYSKYKTWTKAGLIKSKEDTYEGIENFNKTFLRLFSGNKIGKLILKIND